MKMPGVLVLLASMLKKQEPADSSVLLQQHFTNVRKISKQLKADGDIIQMTQQVEPIDGGYQSVLWHGLTHSSEQKTFVQTKEDGTVNTWTEAVEQMGTAGQ
jgi:hypothetical protein